jgi:hypothetical protein
LPKLSEVSVREQRFLRVVEQVRERSYLQFANLRRTVESKNARVMIV